MICVPKCKICSGRCVKGKPDSKKVTVPETTSVSEVARARKPSDGETVTHCQYYSCTRRWKIALDTRYLSARDWNNLTAGGTDRSKIDDIIALCDQCYRKIKRSEGVILGYTKNAKGQTRRYVEEELF